MWTANIPCPFCRLRGDQVAAHRVTHDGTTPPDPARRWGVRCPCTHRFQIVDPSRFEWMWEGRYLGYHVPLREEPLMTEW